MGGPTSMARPGGAAGKLGDQYELSWAARHALKCLLEPGDSISLEEFDPDLSRGSEFTYYPKHGPVSVHQTKRQMGSRNHWTVSALARARVFSDAAEHVGSGREYHFISQTPCAQLKDLCHGARDAVNLEAMSPPLLSQELYEAFREVADHFDGPAQAWQTLRGCWFEVHDEDELRRTNELLASLLLDGASPEFIVSHLADRLITSMGRRMSQRELLALLGPDISLRPVQARQSARDDVERTTRAWASTVTRDLLEPAIARAEPAAIVGALTDQQVALVVAAAGGGKSAVLHQTVKTLVDREGEVLAFRLDHLDAFASTTDLGRQLGFSTSPTVALAQAADGRDAYLVIDQLDAVSEASGRMPERFSVVAELVSEALSLKNIRVIMACRQFDVDHDHRFRRLTARPDVRSVTVAELDVETIRSAVHDMGLDASSLTPSQLDVLRTPLHLVLLQGIASQPGAIAFHSRGSLFEAFWDRKRSAARQRHPGVRFSDVLSRVATAASENQALWVDVDLLDAEDLIDDANVLISEQVLARDGYRVSFFHETFFDYAFARKWVQQGESLRDFLTAGEQELFRRAQVRQILQLLRERDPARFRAEVERTLLDPDIRFHIKETVIAVFGSLEGPTAPGQEDLEVAHRVAAVPGPVADRVWKQLARPGWFRLLKDQGEIARWLDAGDPVSADRALTCMTASVNSCPSEVTAALRERLTGSGFESWVLAVAFAADLPEQRAVFDLLLDMVRRISIDFPEQEVWLAAHDLGERRPEWAIELIAARFINRPSLLVLQPGEEIATLKIREYTASEVIGQAAANAPAQFAKVVVPFLLDVMAATAWPPSGLDLAHDPHFGLRSPGAQHDERSLGEALYGAALNALQLVAGSDPAEFKPQLAALAAAPHDSAQFLLYRALTAAAPNLSEEAAELILRGGPHLQCGYTADPHWATRDLVQAISPHVNDQTFVRLENLLRDLRNPYDTGRWFGHTAFKFLSALDSRRLSNLGARRLEEYRRKFKVDEPSAPRGAIGYVVGSPIDGDSARKMSDEHWMKAIEKHNRDRELGADQGGATELAQVLRGQTSEHPGRFARLALALNADTHPAFFNCILDGLGSASTPDADLPLLFDAVRHIAGLNLQPTERWLGSALRNAYSQTPLDVVDLICDRALHSANPADDKPFFRRSDDPHPGLHLHGNGMNTTRGSMADTLAELLDHDADGTRTARIRPHLNKLAVDPIVSVRCCVANTLSAALAHDQNAVFEAFDLLIAAPDFLLASDPLRRLMIRIGNLDPQVVEPVIHRMLASTDEDVRRAGGAFSAFAAIRWERPHLLPQAMSLDAPVRHGAAQACAANAGLASDARVVFETLTGAMHDEDDGVREAAAEFVRHINTERLQPFEPLVRELVASPAYPHASLFLFRALEKSVDEVDALVALIANRTLDDLERHEGDDRPRGLRDVRHITKLVFRGLAQARDPERTAALLNVLDRLLETNAYGVEDALKGFDRT
jgi:hypothetical protein